MDFNFRLVTWPKTAKRSKDSDDLSSPNVFVASENKSDTSSKQKNTTNISPAHHFPGRTGFGATKKSHLLAGKKSHGQVAHGDISLENALLGSDGEVQDGMLRTSFQSNKKWNCWWWGGTFEVWCSPIPVLWEKEVLRCWVIWTKLEKMHGKKFEVEGSYPHANRSVMSGHQTFHPHFEGI